MLDQIKIEIPSAQTRELKGTSQRTGRDYHICTQDAYLHTGGRYPDKCEVPAIRNADRSGYTAYPPGMYSLTPAHVVVRDGRISIDLYAAPLVSLDTGTASKAASAVK